METLQMSQTSKFEKEKLKKYKTLESEIKEKLLISNEKLYKQVCKVELWIDKW